MANLLEGMDKFFCMWKPEVTTTIFLTIPTTS